MFRSYRKPRITPPLSGDKLLCKTSKSSYALKGTSSRGFGVVESYSELKVPLPYRV